MKKICVIGAFDFRNMATGGQPVKTRELYYALCEKYGESSITYIDTLGWKKHPFRLLMLLIKSARTVQNFIMLPASNGVFIFTNILVSIKKIYSVHIYYDVIGGWLPKLIKEKKRLNTLLKNFDGIWVETSSMKTNLELSGLDNVTIVPNFKSLNILSSPDLSLTYEYPLQVCTFSRVMKEKGIEDAVYAVKEINIMNASEVIILDIYGPIDEYYREEFEQLIEENAGCVRYCGEVSPNRSVETIRKYFALLFPTHFYTEGIPGTLIDSFSAGVPVISAKWENSDDVFIENVTGWSYEFGNYNDFLSKLEKAVANPAEFVKMKKSTLSSSNKYDPRIVIEQIDQLISSIY